MLGVMLIRRTARKSRVYPSSAVSLNVESALPLRAAGKAKLNDSVTPDRKSAWPSPTFPNSNSTATTSEPTGLITSAALCEQLRKIDWFQFEKLVELIYLKHGYAVTRRGGANPDGGIDMVMDKADQRTAVQCKQWKTWKVGVKAVREFLGALTDAGIAQGVFVTLGGCTGEAKQLADKHGIIIVDEIGLIRLIEQANAHRDPATLALIMDTRKFCPKCGREMVQRIATRGHGAGQRFWGCLGYSGYPRCRYTLPWSDEHQPPQSSRKTGNSSIGNLANLHSPFDVAIHKASA